MKKISTLLAAGAIVSAGLLLPGTASAAPCTAALGCYTDGTPREEGLSYWQAKEKAAKEAAAEAAANPAPSFLDNLGTFTGWFTGSAGGE
ncbi:hypothetical protein [Rhodococcus triatomae]|nr:hypothetical protein G419_11072 [Rhodococcus triatomae BKS 15-14]